MFVYGLIHMCKCMRKPEADIRNIPVTLPLFLRQDLSKLNLELEDSVILASESQGSPCLCLPILTLLATRKLHPQATKPRPAHYLAEGNPVHSGTSASLAVA